MYMSLFSGAWDLWELRHKVVFDPEVKLIYVNPDVAEINVQIDLYSDSKEWLQIDDNARYAPPIRSVGGDPLPGGSPLGRTFFLINGWRILLDHAVVVTGNLYSENFASPYLVQDGVQLASEQRSNLVDVVEPVVNIDPSLFTGLSADIAEAVWQFSMSGATAEERLRRALTLAQFLALK